MTTPEARARQHIDELLTAAGWAVQGRPEMNLGAARGVAVREFPPYTDGRDPQPRSRGVFAFHRPETLLEWVREVETQNFASLRARLQHMPPLITTGL
jgi:type I restriction enzyme R subunit